MVSVELRNIHKSFGKKYVLKGINLHVKEAELLVVLGPSGCGKTTTLKIIAGLLKPDRGKVFFDGVNVTELPPQERNVGFVFQNLALFPHLTVWENIAFGLEARGWPRERINARVKEMIEFFEIGELKDYYPRQLSGGQQQRVALARALAPEPNILLLDEPFSNLDAPLREKFRWELRRIQKDLGITTIFVTHDQAEAFQIADHIAIMLDGKIVQIGKPHEIYEFPKNEKIALFLGLNVLKVSKSIQRTSLPCEIGKKILVWPEDIEIVPYTDNNVLKATVIRISLQRGLWRILLKLEDNQYLEAVSQNQPNFSENSYVGLMIKKCREIA